MISLSSAIGLMTFIYIIIGMIYECIITVGKYKATKNERELYQVRKECESKRILLQLAWPMYLFKNWE